MTVRRLIIVAAFALAVGLLGANLLSIATAEDSWYDMQLLLQIVDGWWHGERTLYPTFAEGQQAPGFPSYRYPPVWAVSMMPLISVFELRPAVAIWSVFSTLLLLVGLVAALSRTGIRWLSFRTAAIVWLLALLAPLYETYFGPTKELASVGLLGLIVVLYSRLGIFMLESYGGLEVVGHYFIAIKVSDANRSREVGLGSKGRAFDARERPQSITQRAGRPRQGQRKESDDRAAWCHVGQSTS